MPRLQSPLRFRVLIMERVNNLIKIHISTKTPTAANLFPLFSASVSFTCSILQPKHLLFLSSSFQLVVPSFRFKAIWALAQTRRMLDMGSNDIDSDVKRWGLHLLDVCTYANDSSQNIVTQFEYDPSLNQVGYVREGYFQPSNVENDEAIAQAFQEELSKVHSVEASEWSRTGADHVQASVLEQDWLGSSKRHSNYDEGSDQACLKSEEEEDLSKILNNEMGISCSYPHAEKASYSEEECSYSLEIMDETSLDGEVGKRLNQMFPIPHVPKTIEKLPSADEEISDHERLLERLQLYDLVEQKVDGDGNCQFRALSDQLYRSPEHHDFVRQQIVGQLNTFQDIYEGYVSMPYDEYLTKMSKKGEWGDHVTLQAAADWFGVKIFVITSFKDTCYIEILPYIEKSNRVICLSFWAEVHYNSIYPEGELPASCSKKKKWWNF